MCEISDPSTSREEMVRCKSAIKGNFEKSLRYILKRCYKEQVEGFNPGGIFQRARVPAQTRDKTRVQVSMSETPKRTQE